jgi:hypothetical protein
MAVRHGLSEEMKGVWKQWKRCSRLYCMGQGKERRNEVTTENEKLDKQRHEGKKSWLEHLQRTSSERAPKQFLYYQPIGRRDPRRSKRK